MLSAQVQLVSDQIKENCNISDARYGGNLSLCNMLLRLRQLYFNENSLKPWHSCENNKIIKWIDEREHLWNRLEDRDLSKINIENRDFDPLENAELNDFFQKQNLVYGAGIGMFGKPQFFLARSIKEEERGNIRIHYLDKESCTDLLPSLAMSQGSNIYIRKQILISYLFYRFRDRKSGSILDQVFSIYGLNQKAGKSKYSAAFSSLADDLYDLIVLHEISEIKNRNDKWATLLTNGVPKHTELFFRTMKDCISDLSDDGPLAHIVSEKKEELLYLYQAFFNHWQDSFYPSFPGLIDRFKSTKDFGIFESFRKKNFDKIKKIYTDYGKQLKKEGLEKINQIVISIQKKPEDILTGI